MNLSPYEEFDLQLRRKLKKYCGEGGIRTPVTLMRRKTDFESVPINRSGTSPGES